MCGIAGIFNPLTPLPPEEGENCARMMQAMSYRGPDEEGLFKDAHAVLGHRRLSIIDLSTGQQPMKGSRSTILVFNGEIYNFQELRHILEKAQYPFKTRSDTEVILAGYEIWGLRVLEKLRGMFAFALYDQSRRLLFAARDPIGKKPLYYYRAGDGTIYFASDLQALASSGALSGRISKEALQFYFSLGYIPAPYSIYEGVYKLEAGEQLTCSQEGMVLRKYWELDPGRSEPKQDEVALQEFEQLLDQAVKRRLIAEVPLGALLSGGIDSNLVVSAMARLSDSPVRTYTAGFGQKTKLTGTRDERDLASLAAAEYGTVHEQIEIDGSINELTPHLVNYLGEPLADASILPTYLVCKAARQKVTVALTGDGGDEPFGGYSFRYLPHLMEQKIRHTVPACILEPASSFMAAFWPGGSWVPRILRLKTIFRNLANSPTRAFFMDQAVRDGGRAPLRAEVSSRELPFERVSNLYNKAASCDELTRILYVDVRLYMPEDVLVKADRMSMANSLELRSPLLDQDVIEYAFSLPASLKIRGRQCKYLLKRLASRRIAPSLLNQPKTGFSIPVDFYLRQYWSKDFETSLLYGSNPASDFIDLKEIQVRWRRFLNGDRRDLQLLWSLYILAIWFREFHLHQTFRS
jgi:asparagine synthase (glutamine-hydrolysing)